MATGLVEVSAAADSVTFACEFGVSALSTPAVHTVAGTKALPAYAVAQLCWEAALRLAARAGATLRVAGLQIFAALRISSTGARHVSVECTRDSTAWRVVVASVAARGARPPVVHASCALHPLELSRPLPRAEFPSFVDLSSTLTDESAKIVDGDMCVVHVPARL